MSKKQDGIKAEGRSSFGKYENSNSKKAIREQNISLSSYILIII
ncbi:hypothetical protein [Porphyromonas canoris]|nr:hypothetical protein [Porphyromonas canoris]